MYVLMPNERNEMKRQICVIDPAWVRVDECLYTTAWGRLLTEAAACGFVGADMEWSPNSQRAFDYVKAESETGLNNSSNEFLLERKHSEAPVAIVQLSTFSVTFVIKLCDLFRMASSDVHSSFLPMKNTGQSLLFSTITDNLRLLLADESIAKVGVGIFGDKKKLQRDYPSFTISFCVELQTLAQRLFPSNEDVLKLRSLSDFAARFASTELKKDILVRCSDWGGCLGALSPLQVRYAAGDAEASFDACAGMFGESQLAAAANEEKKELLRAVAAAAPQKERWRKSITGKYVAKLLKRQNNSYYDSVVVYDINMQPIFVVDKAKAQSYVEEKGIAKVVEWSDAGEGETIEAEKDIAAIQLNFVLELPKYNDARIQFNFDYFRQPKKLCCVACGVTEDLVPFFVVPLAYRRYFPLVYIIYKSYDVLLLCKECFVVTQKLYDKERNKLASDYGVLLKHIKRENVEQYLNQLRQELSATATAGSNDEKNILTTASDDAGDCLPLAERVRNLEDCLEAVTHRDIIIKIFTFAKNLCTEYETQAVAGESDAKEINNTNIDAQNNGKHLKSGTIPEECRVHFVNYIREHAPRYPFVQDESVQAELFAADAASPASIHCILKGGRSFRQVLTQFWLREHPEERELLSRDTRTGCCGADGESLGLPWCEMNKENNFVDSHGFFVVRSVMRKYSGHPSKTSDNAIGEFIYRWRKAFLEGMQPKHLPNGWVAEEGILL